MDWLGERENKLETEKECITTYEWKTDRSFDVVSHDGNNIC